MRHVSTLVLRTVHALGVDPTLAFDVSRIESRRCNVFISVLRPLSIGPNNTDRLFATAAISSSGSTINDSAPAEFESGVSRDVNAFCIDCISLALFIHFTLNARKENAGK